MRILVPSSMKIVDSNTLHRFLGVDSLITGCRHMRRPSTSPDFTIAIGFGNEYNTQYDATVVVSLVPQMNGHHPYGEVNIPVAIAAIEVDHDNYWYVAIMFGRRDESLSVLPIVIESASEPEQLAIDMFIAAAQEEGAY